MKKRMRKSRKIRGTVQNTGKRHAPLRENGMPAGRLNPGRFGTLYLVATPIGNLEDITLRAIRIMKEVSLIAAEDTRHTRVLLEKYAVSTPLTSLYDQIEREKSHMVIERLLKGDDVAYVSDAGTPGISDPGFILVREAVSMGIKVSPIPGASALLSSICVSGLPMETFVFMGFLPSRKSQRTKMLRETAAKEKTAIIYESPRRLFDLLNDIAEIWGDREVVISRELTKIHEEFIRGSVKEALSELQSRAVKGEITLIVAGSSKELTAFSDEAIIKRAKELFGSQEELTLRDVVDRVAKETQAPRRRVYQLLLP
jgi:16S rRNA (cytidine1402-2'-O)-methyltransferase